MKDTRTEGAGVHPAPFREREPPSPDAVLRSMERCTKCGACEAHCPVAGVTSSFPGPKYTGPQAQRFRIIEQVKESAPFLCSGCGICMSVCPNDVAITDIIALAKAELVNAKGGVPLGQRILNRPDLVGRIGGAAPKLANAVLGSRVLRRLAETMLGIHREAPLPMFHGPAFRTWLARHPQPEGPLITYFTGCAVENYEPHVGRATVRVLNHLGYRVEAPSEACCALPMLSSGDWAHAETRARRVVHDLTGSAEAGRHIVSTSTSCSLTLRDKYAAYLGLNDAGSRRVADAVVDICEFLRAKHTDPLKTAMNALPRRILYHGPCQLRGHHVGQPAVELLRLIPGLELQLSEAQCCGVAGTYGYDRDKHLIATAVGQTLFDRGAETKPDFVVCDSETCRWHIEQATGITCLHPIEFVACSILDADPADRKIKG